MEITESCGQIAANGHVVARTVALCSRPLAGTTLFPTALVLQPPPSHLGHTRWLSLSLSSPIHPWQISASPAPTSPHDRSGRPNITLQERLKPQWFEQVREVSHIFYPLPTHPDFRHRCRSDLQRDSRATLVHPQATRGSREGCTRCPLRP